MKPDLARRSCFVVAPHDVPVADFLESLRKERIEPFFISDFLKSSNSAVLNRPGLIGGSNS
jgi:hypothetical protein